MSEEFTQFKFPCKICLVKACCQDYDKLDEEKKHVLSQRFHDQCLAVPLPQMKPSTVIPEKSYHKMLMECWANLGVQICSATQKQYQDGLEKNNTINEDLFRAICFTADFLQWMVNSTSWSMPHEGLQKFDSFELDRKIDIVKQLVSHCRKGNKDADL